MRAPTKPKPTAVDEVVRTLRLMDMIEEQMKQRSPTPSIAVGTRERIAILTVAERIAARTTD